ncbi:S41 family peptidase [Aestuariibius sp. HNIBRBA575]|uniref:S41 family peptidase n=1 Tax=Aestuariibius sp. HNIBRBA575 TaxID=3233343 RepID=UPI0034A1DF7E
MVIRQFLRWALRGALLFFAAFAVTWPFFGPDRNMRGIWMTQGYGYILDIGRFQIDLYQHSDAHCLIEGKVPAHSVMMSVLAGYQFEASQTELVARVEGAVNPIRADRIDALPPLCAEGTTPIPGSSFANYHAFWTIFDQHYPFFALHNVDWNDRQAQLAPSDQEPLTNDALWDRMVQSIKGLDDGHTYIYRPDAGIGYSPANDVPWEEDLPAFRDLQIARGLTDIPNTGLSFTILDGNIGYVLLRHMETKSNILNTSTGVANSGFGQIADALQDTKAIILDNRFNPGGSDDISMAYAAFFADDTERLAFSKRTRMSVGFSETTEIILRRNADTEIHLDQPVYLLNSEFTASAAEIFTMAIQDLPNVTILGEPTAGHLSDILEMRLPNGWIVGLSHQIYLDGHNVGYEGLGVPPDQAIAMPTDALRNGMDPMIDDLLAELRP